MIPMIRIPFLNKLNKRKTVSVVRLNGLIASGARGGISDSALAPIFEKAFRNGNPSAVVFIINSPGGSVTAGLSIYDTMQFINCDVSTICVGQAASMGALLLSGGENGKRFALPHSRIMVHQPSAGFQGQATDIDIHAKEVLELKHRLNKIMATHTGQKIAKIEKDLERDNFMSSNEAKSYGLIDTVLSKRNEMK